MQIVLSKPLMSADGQTKLSKTISPVTEGQIGVEVIDMNLDALTGADVEFCVREASSAKGEMVRVLVTDLDFHIHLAAQASGVAVNDLRRLSARDFVEVATSVQAFLTGSV
jgi:hypothetical protein